RNIVLPEPRLRDFTEAAYSVIRIVSHSRYKYCFPMPREPRAPCVSSLSRGSWSKRARRRRSLPEGRSLRPTILWIDDFAGALTMYKFMFENLGFRVLTALCGEQGIRLAAVHRVDVVV